MTLILFGLAAVDIEFLSSELLITLSGVTLICSVIVGFVALISRIAVGRKRKMNE